jgi:hypothetical protein
MKKRLFILITHSIILISPYYHRAQPSAFIASGLSLSSRAVFPLAVYPSHLILHVTRARVRAR